MNKLLTAIAGTLIVATPVFSLTQTAMLVRCRLTMTRGGDQVYVGTYRVSGQEVQFTFREYCPSTIEVDQLR